MLRRKARADFEAWRGQRSARALLVTGARQVGKTFLVKRFLKDSYNHVVEFDLVEQPDVREVFDQIPSQLDSQGKRFKFAGVAPQGTYERYRDELLWLVDAGVALPVTSVSEPRHPLKLSEGRSYFKLFMDDVGLLSAACGMEVVKSIVSDRLGVNYGSIYENAVAQELHAHGHALHYFRNKKAGELDFVIEAGNGNVLPVEVKSGKDYKRHSALTNVLGSGNYVIDHAIVLCEGNLAVEGRVVYCPVYMAACL